MAKPIYIRSVGMACPVGLRWTHACAAMRAGITRKQELPYKNNKGDPIVSSYLSSLSEFHSARKRWLSLLTYAISDALSQLDFKAFPQGSLLLTLPCDSHGKAPNAAFITQELSAKLNLTLLASQVKIITEGASAGFQAIARARELLAHGEAPVCVVAAADSLINARNLSALNKQRRLLTEENSDGVIPGEAAACLVLLPNSHHAIGKISGLGFAQEKALLNNDIPLRGDGLTAATKAALGEAGLGMHDIDFRLSDAAGESYSFKEQSLMVSRVLRQRKETFPVWESATTLGDTGAAAGFCGIISAIAGFQRGYAPGPRAIAFAGNESGERAALVLEATQMKEARNG